jgi:adenylate cyclase
MLQLRYEQGGVTRTHRLTEGLTVIGRLPTCDLVLKEPSVSRQHARVTRSAASVVLEDAGSRYGTYLSGVVVQDPISVPLGATIRVGEVSLVLEQHLSEGELLNEAHDVSSGPGTIYRALAPALEPIDPGVGHLIRLLAEVGRALLSTDSLHDVLNRVVDLAFGAVPAERAFLMLRESPDAALAARVLRHRDGSVPEKPTLSRMVVNRVLRDRVAILAADATSDPGLGVTDSILRFNIRSFMCAPLWNREEVIGVLYVDSPRSGQFKAADLDAFTAVTNAAAIAIEQARLSSQLLEETRRRERLQRYHSPAVVSRIINSEETGDELGAQERDVTVMFCDLVGFTALCESLTPLESAALLNTFLTRMTDVVFDHEGTLDKFLGDALLAVFGAPFDQTDHAVKAVQAALAMRRALRALNRSGEGPVLAMRIAINTGSALTGDMGSPRRREFTVLGDVVNTAARMEDEVAAPGEIVITAATRERLGSSVQVRSIGVRALRGRAVPVELFAVDD